MDPQRLPVKPYNLEKTLKIKGWVQNVKLILQYCNMSECIPLDDKYDLDVASARLLRLNRERWWLEASTKTKLENFVKVYDRNEKQCLVRIYLS